MEHPVNKCVSVNALSGPDDDMKIEDLWDIGYLLWCNKLLPSPNRDALNNTRRLILY